MQCKKQKHFQFHVYSISTDAFKCHNWQIKRPTLAIIIYVSGGNANLSFNPNPILANGDYMIRTITFKNIVWNIVSCIVVLYYLSTQLNKIKEGQIVFYIF